MIHKSSASENAGEQFTGNRFAPTVMLFFLAPLIGEYLLGNLKFTELYHLPFLALLYGAGAIVIREITRRNGRGYATILTLGVAYSLFEEGLIDQMLFNPSYFTDQKNMMNTVVPALGLDVWLTLLVTGMHAVWSICIPIILVEGIFSKFGKEPWLSKAGLGVMVLILTVGAAWISYETYLETKFWALKGQLIGTTIVIMVIIIAAFALKVHQTVLTSDFVPTPWMMFFLSLISSSLFMLTELLPGWSKVVACLLIALIFFALIYRWAGSRNWSELHGLALATGGILTYAWLGAVMPPETGPKNMIDHVGTAIFIIGTIVLTIVAIRRRLKIRSRASIPNN